ncbi:MAG: DMT family transporter [Lysinibacillus sp.]
MAWFALVVAGCCEAFGVLMIMRLNNNRDWQSLALLVLGFSCSFLLLSIAMETLPMSTAYAVWTGIGASIGAILGMLFYGESRSWKRILCIALIISGAVGLKLVA